MRRGAIVQFFVEITAYRPSNELEERFNIAIGREDSAWEFVRSHLRQLPVFVQKDSRVETVVERQDYLLYDRMVAFHVQRGYAVPLSTSEFHAGLRQRFPERDGMYFLPDQVSEYDRRRIDVIEVEQLQMFVSDEKTAVQWVRRQLAASPMTFRDLQPVYMKEAQLAWQKHEQPVDLRLVLEQNFVEERDEFPRKSSRKTRLSSCTTTTPLRGRANDRSAHLMSFRGHSDDPRARPFASGFAKLIRVRSGRVPGAALPRRRVTPVSFPRTAPGACARSRLPTG